MKKKAKPKVPKLLTFLLSQINKGNIPTEDELLDVFEELPQKYYKDVCLALLSAKPSNTEKIQEKEVKPSRKSRVKDDDGALTAISRPQPQPKKVINTRVDPNKVHTPGSWSWSWCTWK